MRILIAEDDPVTAKILASTLMQWGHEVDCVSDGNAAWDALSTSSSPRLAILDWMMPGLDGIDVCRQIRSHQNEHYTYIILLTARSNKEDIVSGLEAGADDYLTKPFDPNELRVRLGVGERILGLESELLNALHRLQKSQQNRAEFISALTHDLRTPLAAEQRVLEVLLLNKAEFNERTQNLLGGLVSNNQTLLKLVNQLLEGFQSEEGAITLNKIPVSLHTLATQSISSLATLAERKEIALLNRIPEDLPDAYVDFQHIHRVLTNLIANAINHIPDGSTVELSGRKTPEHLEIVVEDNGQGIPTELLPTLFERYAVGSGLRRKLGNGLGLSICKHLVEAHDGTIRVESASGQGTRFCITLPLS